MNPDVRKILRLQSCDQEIRTLKGELATLPGHIAEIEKQLDSHKRKLEADQAAASANARDRKRLEGTIQEHEQKISKLKTQMLDARTNEQYRAFQNEITHCETEIRKIEDQILELMEDAESLEKNVKAAEAELAVEKKQVDAEKAAAKAQAETQQKQLEELIATRAEVEASLPPNRVADYNRIRKKWKNGLVAVEVVNELCTGCMLVLRPQHFQDLKVASDVVFCENCGRVIYYNPPESFEGDVAAGPGTMPIRRIS